MYAPQENGTFVYAGFWWRYPAHLLDFFFLSVGGGLLRIGTPSTDTMEQAPTPGITYHHHIAAGPRVFF
jgi:hypothetical protein